MASLLHDEETNVTQLRTKNSPAAVKRHKAMRKQVVDLIRAVMQESTTTQAELGRRIGVTESAIGALLNGWSFLSLDKLVDIAFALGKRVEIRLVDRKAPRDA